MDKNMSGDKTGFIHIVGMNSLQNELLLLFLKEKNNFMGRCAQNLKTCRPLQENKSILPQLLLLDYESIDRDKCWSDISEWKDTVSSHFFVAGSFRRNPKEMTPKTTLHSMKLPVLFMDRFQLKRRML